jgi:hypothetical protein
MAQQPKVKMVKGEMGGTYTAKAAATWKAGASKALAKAKAPVSPKEKAAMAKNMPKEVAKLKSEFKKLNPAKKK